MYLVPHPILTHALPRPTPQKNKQKIPPNLICVAHILLTGAWSNSQWSAPYRKLSFPPPPEAINCEEQYVSILIAIASSVGCFFCGGRGVSQKPSMSLFLHWVCSHESHFRRSFLAHSSWRRHRSRTSIWLLRSQPSTWSFVAARITAINRPSIGNPDHRRQHGFWQQRGSDPI